MGITDASCFQLSTNPPPINHPAAMSLSPMDKEVVTRLFRMLAVSETKKDAIQRDSASYAKLSLLTQQMALLQQQAQHVVDSSSTNHARLVDEMGLVIEETCMALSTEYDEGAKRLLSMLDVSEKSVAVVKQNHASCAKLSILSTQVGLLQQQAQKAIDEAELSRLMTEISDGNLMTLTPGTFYYHYTQNGKAAISMIGPHEWCFFEEFHGKYLYDFDFTFRRIEDITAEPILPKVMLPLLGSQPCGIENTYAETIPASIPICRTYSRFG